MSYQVTELKPLKRSPKERAVVAFTTVGSGTAAGFNCGALADGQRLELYHRRDTMLAALTSWQWRGAWLWSPALELDLAVLTGGDFSAFSCLFAFSRLLWADTQDRAGHQFRLCDLQNLYPNVTMAELAAMTGCPVPVPPGGAKYAVSPDLGSLSPSHALADDVTQYCLSAVQVTLAAVQGLQAELLELGGQLQPTIAGCARDLYRRAFQQHAWTTPHLAVNRMARAGYYGGRVEPVRLGRTTGVNVYDANSLYPAAQRVAELPDPKGLTIDPAPTSPFDRLRYPGLSYVTVDLPPDRLPPLPVHVGEGVYFPAGRVTACWCHNELRAALDNGVKLRHTHWSWYAARSVTPFVDYVDNLYRLKAACRSDQPVRRQVLKLLLNSLYGSWGVSTGDALRRLVPLRQATDMAAYPGAELKMINELPYLLVPLATDSQPAYANTIWAATITAEARCMMLPWLARSYTELVYTDTDSLAVTGQLPIGPGLGELRQEHAGVELVTYAPKEYVLADGAAMLAVACKGVPESLRLDYLAGLTVTFDSPAGILEATGGRHAPGVARERVRRRRAALPKRAPLASWAPELPSVPTRPWQTAELAQLVQVRFDPAGQVPVCLTG